MEQSNESVMVADKTDNTTDARGAASAMPSTEAKNETSNSALTEDGSVNDRWIESNIEAILFTMGHSVEVRQLSIALEISQEEAMKAALSLKEKYEREDRGIRILELEDSFQMCSKAECYESLIRIAKVPKKQMLSEATLETLSIIAYKQPVTRAEIENIRGVSSAYSVNKLIEYGLVYEAGRLDVIGRPALFATTEEFLRRFGVGSTKELPSISRETEERIISEVEEEVNYKFGVESDIREEFRNEEIEQ